MKRIITPLLLVVFSALAQNLLNNSDFSQLYGELPTDWKTNVGLSPAGSAELLPNGGPSGENAMRLRLEKMVTYGQGGLYLVPGEKYRIGMYLRTEGFSCNRGGISIANFRWHQETPNREIPSNTDGKWVKYELEVTCPQPEKGEYRFGSRYYSVNIYATSAKGILDVASPYLIPMSEAAFQGSRRAVSFIDSGVIVPVSPLLDQIPDKNATIRLYCPQYAEGRVSAIFRTAPRVPSAKAELKEHYCEVSWESLYAGESVLTVDVMSTDGNTRLLTSDYPVTIVPTVTPTPMKRLNNFVHEIFNEPAVNGEKSFAVADTGWIYVAVDSGNVSLDGESLPLEAREGRQEAMVHVLQGAHVLHLQNVTDGMLTLRKIPELFLHPFHLTLKPDYAKSRYDYEYMKKYLYPGFNTFNFNSTWHNIYNENIESLRNVLMTNRRVIGSGGMAARKWNDAMATFRELNFSAPNLELGGRTVDELHASSSFHQLQTFTDALWLLRRQPARIYTWLEWGGGMCDPQVHTNFISAQMNASNGQGKLLSECYFRTYANIDEQLKELHHYRDMVAQTRAFHPDYPKGLLVISGGYQIPGVLSTVQSPEADPKVSQDMFFNMCANDDAYRDLYGFGVYAFRSSDEEMARWYAKLMRHYGIEGKKTMLSDEYGYRLAPAHLSNCDFKKGLDGWTPAGPVKAETVPGYGKSQGRQWMLRGRPLDGDEVAVLSADGKGAVGSISQKATGLKPNALYSLTYVVAESKHAREQKPAEKDVKLVTLDISDAEIIETQIIDQNASKKAFIPVKVIFRPKNSDALVRFTSVSPEGDVPRDILLNYISLRPFFD